MVISTNFELPQERLKQLEDEVWKVVQKHNCMQPNPTTTPIYLVEIQFYGDIEQNPTWSKAIWLRFATDDYLQAITIKNSKEMAEIVKKLEEIVIDYFEQYEGVWEVNVWAVIPL